MPGIAPLSRGVIPLIMHGDEVIRPVLQILGVKRIMAGETERLRLLISDSQYFNSYAMLATQLNSMYNEDKLKENTIVRLDKYVTSIVSKSDIGKRVLIILEMTVLNSADEVKQKVGEPISYTEAIAQQLASSAASAASSPSSSSLAKSTFRSSMSGASSHSLAATSNGRPQTNIHPSSRNINLSPYINSNRNMDHSFNDAITHPISSLCPYINKWVIKARVTSKSPIRTWSNARGEGKLFSIDLMDESGEIRATVFRELCDKFFDLIEVDELYFISKCQLKPANKQFTTLKNDYEMTFTNETVLQLCTDKSENIPTIKYNLIPISKIADLETKTAVDVIGICKVAGELQTFTSRTTNKEFKKRELTLVDTSNAAVVLTLWGDDAVNFDGYVQPVILVRGGRINEFNGGKTISVGNGSNLKINPDITEGHKLRGWFDNGGGDNISNLVSARTGGGGGAYITEWRTFHEARNLGTSDKPDYFQTKAVIHLVRSQNAFYKACPQADCNKKVAGDSNANYLCERCNETYHTFKYRLLLNMSIGDWTSNRWVTCFSDLAEQLLKRTAQEVGEALENDPKKAEDIFAAINFRPYVFKIRSKVETFGDVTRSKLVAHSASPVNYKEYNRYLVNNLKEFTGIKKS